MIYLPLQFDHIHLISNAEGRLISNEAIECFHILLIQIFFFEFQIFQPILVQQLYYSLLGITLCGTLYILNVGMVGSY